MTEKTRPAGRRGACPECGVHAHANGETLSPRRHAEWCPHAKTLERLGWHPDPVRAHATG